MTQTLIEQLNGLQQYVINYRDDDMGIGLWPVECKGDLVKMSDLRAIIERYKREASPQPDILAELVRVLSDDAHAGTFQSMAGYRSALIAKVKGMMG